MTAGNPLTGTITVMDDAFNSPQSVQLSGTAMDFSLSAAPITLFVGTPGSGQVTVNSLYGFNSPVTLTVTAMPAGVAASFSATAVTPPAGGTASLTLNLSLSPLITPTTFSLTVTGSFGTLTRSINVSVTVKADTSSIGNVISQLTAAGCIDNSGIANALTSKLAAAQASIAIGDIRSATNALGALLKQISAQSGKHIAASCTAGGVTFDPATVLGAEVSALIAALKANPDPLVGNVVNLAGVGIPGATVTIFDSTNTAVGTAVTDATGFYFVARTGVLGTGSTYTAARRGRRRRPQRRHAYRGLHSRRDGNGPRCRKFDTRYQVATHRQLIPRQRLAR